MCPQEFYLIYDTHRPHDPGIDYAGRLNGKSCDELMELLDG